MSAASAFVIAISPPFTIDEEQVQQVVDEVLRAGWLGQTGFMSKEKVTSWRKKIKRAREGVRPEQEKEDGRQEERTEERGEDRGDRREEGERGQSRGGRRRSSIVRLHGRLTRKRDYLL